MAEEEYRVRLDIFEGPLDLLLFLIRKNELDIHDIPIALLTRQYLEYLDLMKSLNVNLAGDFLSMASTLVHIKSRMLLPPSSGDEDEEDPRMELVRPLMEYIQIKEAAGLLGERELLNRDVFVRDFVPEELRELEEDGELVNVSFFDLLMAFKKLMDESQVIREIRMTKERISVQEKMEQLLNRLREKGSLLFTQIFERPLNRSDMVVTFLAMLELIRLGLVLAVQKAYDATSIELLLHSNNDTEQGQA